VFFRHALRINHAAFRAVVGALSDAPIGRVIYCCARPRTLAALGAAVAIRLQPNGNSLLLSGRRADRLIERVDDGVHDTGG
jgi:hypothetical protein